MLELNRAVMRRTNLSNLYREYDFQEIATVTRAATAKALGLKGKGHLGPGADGDVSVYDVDPTMWRPSMYQQIEDTFGRAFYTIKGGEVVVKDGEVVAVPNGTTYWVDAKIPDNVEEDLMRDLREDFGRYYTVSLRNYPVEEAYLPKHRSVSTVVGGEL